MLRPQQHADGGADEAAGGSLSASSTRHAARETFGRTAVSYSARASRGESAHQWRYVRSQPSEPMCENGTDARTRLGEGPGASSSSADQAAGAARDDFDDGARRAAAVASHARASRRSSAERSRAYGASNAGSSCCTVVTTTILSPSRPATARMPPAAYFRKRRRSGAKKPGGKCRGPRRLPPPPLLSPSPPFAPSSPSPCSSSEGGGSGGSASRRRSAQCGWFWHWKKTRPATQRARAHARRRLQRAFFSSPSQGGSSTARLTPRQRRVSRLPTVGAMILSRSIRRRLANDDDDAPGSHGTPPVALTRMHAAR